MQLFFHPRGGFLTSFYLSKMCQKYFFPRIRKAETPCGRPIIQYDYCFINLTHELIVQHHNLLASSRRNKQQNWRLPSLVRVDVLDQVLAAHEVAHSAQPPRLILDTKWDNLLLDDVFAWELSAGRWRRKVPLSLSAANSRVTHVDVSGITEADAKRYPTSTAEYRSPEFIICKWVCVCARNSVGSGALGGWFTWWAH